MNNTSPEKLRAIVVLRILKKLFPQAKIALRYTKPHELLFAVMLSAQTTDIQVNKVTEKLFKKYKTLNSFANATQKQLEKDIQSIGLYKTKAKHIIASAKLLQTDFHNKIPSTIEQLITLPGVGRKTANVILAVLFEKPEGIAVDTHVIRLAQKFGLTKHKNPIKIEQDLMEILQKKEWLSFTLRLIAYGRTYSPARTKTYTDPISLELKKLKLI